MMRGRTFRVWEAAPRAGRCLREVCNKLVCPGLLCRLQQGATEEDKGKLNQNSGRKQDTVLAAAASTVDVS